MKPDRPLITIGIAAHNAEKYVAETLGSILAQDYPNREILVADNASTDRTGEVVRSFLPQGIRYHRHEKNVGPGENFNWTIRHARGNPVAVFHADDVYLPDIVSREAEFLLSHPEAGAVFALDQQIDTDGKIIGETAMPEELKGGGLVSFPDLMRLFLKHGNSFIRCPSLMIRKEVFTDVGPFDEKSFGSAVDTEMWLRISKKYPVGILDKKLFKYRISATQHTSRMHHNRTEPWDHFLAVDHHLQGIEAKIPAGLIRDYRDRKMNDAAMCAANCLLLGRADRARDLLRGTISRELFREAVGFPRRLSHYLVRYSLYGLTRLGLGKPAAAILKKVV